ncbi:DUF11 domain-containing protein [Algoriella sp.]|uniref:DUF11 domain-containing protein n=1 Tax=Algoriella sp. TaxID=1872434 RepID=UPI001B2B389A|nr:DUF11 domain-containing protein [Algoriella sp.]MBO6213561.1 DUF11 domain-containing protein [Algoriella sp.]
MKKILYITLLILSSIGWGQVPGPATNNYNTTNNNGVAVLNPDGGGSNASNGLKIIITAGGNMQIKYLDKFQLNGTTLNGEPSNAYFLETPGFMHGISFTVGSKIFRSGKLYPTGLRDDFSNNRPTVTTSGPNNSVQTWKNTFTLKVGTLNYLLTITYTYIIPQTRINVKYDITIPTGNTQLVQLAHAFDSQLNGGTNDRAPGYKYIAPVKNREAVGVRIHPYFQAMIYESGSRWNGLNSGNVIQLPYYLDNDAPEYGSIFNAFDTDYVEPSESSTYHPDNAYGMSIGFGSTPGTYSTTNNITFTCNAPPAAPLDSELPAGPNKTPSQGTVFPTTTYTLTCADGTQDIHWNGTLPTVDTDGNGVNDIEIQYFRIDPSDANNYIQIFPTSDNKLLVTGSPNPGAKYRIRYYDNYNKCTSSEREVIVRKPACSSDLSIVKTVTTLDTNSTVQPGKTYTITYTARNNGTSDNGGVIVTDNVPAGFTITGTNIPAGTTYSNGVWNIGTITSGTSNGPTKILVLTVTANNYGPHISTATISGASTDSNLLNNTSKPLVYLDSDKDGIPNGDGTATSDLDSDNDGIPDSLEKQACTSPSSILSFTGYKAVLYDNATKYGFDILDSWTEVNAASTFPTTNYHQIATFDYYEHEKKNNAFDISFDIPNLTNIGFTAANSTKIRNFQGTGIKSNTENYDFAVMFNKAITTEEAGTYQINLTEGDNHIFIYKNGVKDIGYKDVWNTTPRPSRSITLAVGDILSILLIEEGAWNTQINAVITKTSGGLCMKDTDLDGIPDHLDLDSDADGCPDAIEGDENVLPTHLNADGSINYAANGGLGAIATNLGVPNLVNSGGAADIGGDVGQGIGT